MQVITIYMYIELMNFMEIGFLPRRISSLTLSALSCPNHNAGYNYMYIHVHVRTLVQVLLEEENTHSGTVGFAPEKHNEPQLFC